jgi:hypothetical protein
MIRLLFSSCLAVFVAGIIGCIAVGGTNTQPTRGQELIDLKAALDRGSINQTEYDATKSQILNHH